MPIITTLGMRVGDRPFAPVTLLPVTRLLIFGPTGQRMVIPPLVGRQSRKQAAQDRGFWNSLQKTYVQQWTSIGWSDDDDGEELGKTEAGRAFQILAVRIRNEDAKRFVRVRGISTT
ncbi:jg21510 [Pararge aegeria aegeria]|uniref:Jg21510 protein n=1 Tax=Pararge aegeria aegeria TaxID=348720 RepID=A0A8S4RPS0_9NEOP|nr:jg21510 [Pararge aegeria aegeria]